MGRKRKTNQEQTFADVFEEVRASAEPGREPMEVRSPIRERQLIDESSTVWRMRGGEVRWSRVERLVRDPAVPVLHVYLDEVREVLTTERDNLLAKIRPYLNAASGDGRGPGDHTDFVAAEFKADDRRSMLVVEEYC